VMHACLRASVHVPCIVRARLMLVCVPLPFGVTTMSLVVAGDGDSRSFLSCSDSQDGNEVPSRDGAAAVDGGPPPLLPNWTFLTCSASAVLMNRASAHLPTHGVAPRGIVRQRHGDQAVAAGALVGQRGAEPRRGPSDSAADPMSVSRSCTRLMPSSSS